MPDPAEERSDHGRLGIHGLLRHVRSSVRKGGISVSRLWRSPQHEEALAGFDYAVRNRRFAVMTAPPGCGKSTALHALSESLPASRFRFICVS